MAAVTDRGPGRSGGPGGRGADLLLRGVAVVGLVCLAALALQARQGLDWDRLAEPVEVRWARVLLGSVVLLVLAVAARRLLRQLRKARSRAAMNDDPPTEPEGEPFPLLLRIAAGLLVLAALAMAWFVIRSIEPVPPPEEQVTGPPPGPPGDASGVPDTRSTVLVLVIVAATLLVGALVSRWLAARRLAGGSTDDEAEQQVEVQRLVAAVDAAGEGLRSETDPRQAVLAAYAAMARHLSSGLSRRGSGARGSDTATELLDRAVEHGLVSGPPARTLTDLFREARFSRHPMGEDTRRRAEQSLAQVRAELVARHD
jgi:Domain of unknown function (DUF4129)